MKQVIILLMLVVIKLTTAAYAAGNVVYVHVNGLVCDFCARALEKTFGKQEAVSDIDVNLDDKIIVINFNDDMDLTDEVIKGFVKDAGYDVVRIERGRANEK